MSKTNNLSYFRDNFNLRFNQYLLFIAFLLLIFYTLIILTGAKQDYSQIPIKLICSFAVLCLGYAIIFYIQVPIYKKLTKNHIAQLISIEVKIDKLKNHRVYERANTFALLNFYVPEYVISFYNEEHQCHFELICIKDIPPYIKEDLSFWIDKTILIDVHPKLLNKKSGTEKPIKVFNFKGMGFDLEKSFFKSISEYVSTLPQNLILYILFPVVTLGIFLLAIAAFAFVNT